MATLGNPRVIRLTIINDLTCSFCYVGHYELLDAMERTIKMNIGVKFAVECRPFQLFNATTTSACECTCLNKEQFMRKKFGDEVFAEKLAGVVKWGKEKGVNIAFSGPISSSTRAHRLARKAFLLGGQRYQLPVINAIFDAYCVKQESISDPEVLGRLAEQVGMMTKDEAIKFVESDELEAEVMKMIEEARSHGISGVPITVIDGKWAVGGGQSSEVFVQIFRKLATCTGAAAGHCPKESRPPFLHQLEKPISA